MTSNESHLNQYGSEFFEELNGFGRLLMDKFSMGINIINRSGKILFANKMMKDLFGEDIEGKICWKICLPSDSISCSPCIERNANISENNSSEFKKNINGKIFKIGRAPFLYNGEKIILEFFHDITTCELEEKKYRKNEESLQIILNNIQDAYFQVDLSGKVTFINKAALSMFGYNSPDEIIGQPTSILYGNKNDRDFLLKKLYQQEEVLDYTLNAMRKNGDTFWVSLNVKFLHDDNNNGSDIQAVIRNITERIETEKVKNELLNRFKLIGKHLPGVIYQYQMRPDGTSFFPYSSEEIQNIYGVCPEDVNTDASLVFQRIHPDDYRHVYDSIIKSSENLSPWNDIYRVNLPSGETIWVEGYSTPQKLEDGSIIWHGYIQNITHRVEQQKEILKAKQIAEKNEQNYHTIIESTNDLIWSIEPNNFGILTYNRALYDYFLDTHGIKIKLGDTPEVLLKDRSRFWLNLYRKVLKCGSYETEYKTQSGNKFLQLSLFAMKHNKDVFAISVFGKDITKLKMNEKELITAKKKAEENNRLKSAFLLNMSHEIRTPMNGILGFMDLLRQTNLSEKERADYIKIINESGDRLLDTINGIIEISKIEAGDIDLRFEQINISELLRYYDDLFRPQIEQKGLELKICMKVSGNAAIMITDKQKLDGILIPLIKNAIKFTDKGQIKIGNYLRGDRIYFYVSDTGRGIPNDKIDIIFDRFVQADNRLHRNYEGSGIGLSIVKAYIEALNGNISVTSGIGKGSTFRFYIPYKKQEQNLID